MSETSINFELLKEAIAGSVYSIDATELIENFEDYSELGWLANNYGLSVDEILKIEQRVKIQFETEHCETVEEFDAFREEKISRKFGVSIGGSAKVEEFHRNYNLDKSGKRHFTIITHISTSPIFSYATPGVTDWIIKEFFSSFIHELCHFLDLVDVTTEEFNREDDHRKQELSVYRNQLGQKKIVEKPYPMIDSEISQVMAEILTLEKDDISYNTIRDTMKERHELTDVQADELMERAMTWKEGSYRKLSDDERAVPVDLGYLKDIIAPNTSMNITSNVYNRLFHGAEDFIDFGLFDSEFLAGTSLSSRDIFDAVKNNIVLKVNDSERSSPRPSFSVGCAQFNFTTGYSSIVINLYLRYAEEVTLKELAYSIWGSFIHEFIHIIRYTRLNHERKMKNEDPIQTSVDLYRHRENQIGLGSEIDRGRKYPFIDDELASNYESFIHLERSGVSTEFLHQYGKEHWELTPDEVDAMIEKSHTYVEGSYRKLSDGIPVNLDFLKSCMSVSKTYFDVYSQLFSVPEEYFEFSRLDNEYLQGTKFSSLNILREVSKNVNLVVYDEFNDEKSHPVGGGASFSYSSGYKRITLRIYLLHAKKYSLKNLARKIWFAFVHEFVHILDYVVEKEMGEKAGKSPDKLVDEMREIYDRATKEGIPGPFKEREIYPNYEAFRQAENAGYSLRELHELGRKLWNLPPRKIDELIERSHTLVEGSYRRLPREQLMFYDSELDFLSKFGEEVERKPGAEFETDHGRYRLTEYHPELLGWYADCVEWKQGAPVKAGVETEYPRLISFIRDYITHRAKYAQSGDSKSVLIRYETLFPGYLESEEIQRLIREKMSIDANGYLEILKHVGAPMGFITLKIRYSRKSPGQIMPFFVNGDVSDSGGMSLNIEADTEDQDIQAYLPEIAAHCWGFFVHEFGHMLDHFNEEDPFAMENAVPKFKKNYYPFQKSELPQAIAFIRAMEEKGKSREYLKEFAMREWELSEPAFDYLYDQAHKVASYRKFSDDKVYYGSSSSWIAPDGKWIDCSGGGHEDWVNYVSELKPESFQRDEDWKSFAKWRKLYKDFYGEDTYLGCDELIVNGWVRVSGTTGFEVNRFDSRAIGLITDFLMANGKTAETQLYIDAGNTNISYMGTFSDMLAGEMRKISSYRKFSDDELKLKDENVDVGRILILHGEDVLPMAKEALANHLYVEGWQAKKVFSAILGISGIGDDYGHLKGSDDIHMAGYYNKADKLVAWAFQFISSSISRYTKRAYRYKGIGTALAVALKEDLGGDLNINERETPRPDGVLENKLVLKSYRKLSTGEAGDVKPCYLITVPQEVKNFIHSAQKKVPKEMLTGQGKPDFPEHVTLLFGVAEDSVEAAKKIINATAPFDIFLKEYAYFDNEDSSVLHVRCESKEMTELHERMKKEIENTHREGYFKAHITVAYLKPDSRVDGLPEISGDIKFRVDEVQLSIPDNDDISKENFIPIRLGGR
jgi:2'-5' RNA ligase